jgi:hypothetical protein
MAWKTDEAANFVSVQLIEQETGIYDKRHPDYARQDKIDLAWERKNISWDIGLWIQAKFSRNNISSSVETITEERMQAKFPFPNIVFKHPVALTV